MTDLRRLLDDIHPEHAGGAAGGTENRDQDAEGRGLARPVGTQQPEDLSRSDLEGDVLDGGDVSFIGFGEARDLDRERAAQGSAPSGRIGPLVTLELQEIKEAAGLLDQGLGFQQELFFQRREVYPEGEIVHQCLIVHGLF